MSKSDELIAYTAVAVTSEQTSKYQDLVFQQHLRVLIDNYRPHVSTDTIKGVLEWEASHLPKEGEAGHAN